MAAPAASAALGFASLPSPKPTLNQSRPPPSHLRFANCYVSSFFHVGRLGLARSPTSRREFGIQPVGLVPSEESKHSDIEVEKENGKVNANSQMLEKAWMEALNNFMAEALKVKAMSEEVYEVYSKKAIENLMDTSEKLKIQADKAQRDLNIMLEEVSEEGKEYLSAAAKNSPDSVKDIVEAYASIDELKTLSAVRDFYLGIPYGCFLAIGGFLDFMFTGNIPAIRFGVILGTAILALSVLSFRSWKNGKATPLLLKAQTAIAAIIFLRQLFTQRGFVNLVMLLISGTMLAFYVYRSIIDRGSKDVSMGHSSESS